MNISLNELPKKPPEEEEEEGEEVTTAVAEEVADPKFWVMPPMVIAEEPAAVKGVAWPAVQVGWALPLLVTQESRPKLGSPWQQMRSEGFWLLQSPMMRPEQQ